MNNAGENNAPPEYVAFYGSLRSGHGFQEQLTEAHQLRYVGACQIPGELFDLGEFPGLVPGGSVVHGELYRVLDPAVFIKLDEYEVFDLAAVETSLFVRRVTRLAHPPVDCWVYFYNLEILGQTKIKSGNWTEYQLRRLGS